MQINWPTALAFVWLPSNDGSDVDEGEGETFATRWGVTDGDWTDAVRKAVVTGTLAAATKADLGQVLHALHWNACNCDALPSGADLMVFNAAMLEGAGYATRATQQAAGTSGTGYGIGPLTVALVEKMGTGAFIDALAALDEAHFRSLASKAKKYSDDLRGWLRRENDAVAAAKELAASAAQQG